jgi:hypothetical protein
MKIKSNVTDKPKYLIFKLAFKRATGKKLVALRIEQLATYKIVKLLFIPKY